MRQVIASSCDFGSSEDLDRGVCRRTAAIKLHHPGVLLHLSHPESELFWAGTFAWMTQTVSPIRISLARIYSSRAEWA
jgi:hypothetical protein